MHQHCCTTERSQRDWYCCNMKNVFDRMYYDAPLERIDSTTQRTSQLPSHPIDYLKRAHVNTVLPHVVHPRNFLSFILVALTIAIPRSELSEEKSLQCCNTVSARTSVLVHIVILVVGMSHVVFFKTMCAFALQCL